MSLAATKYLELRNMPRELRLRCLNDVVKKHFNAMSTFSLSSFLSDFQRHKLQENNGKISNQWFFAGSWGDGGVCVCVLRGVVSWSDLVVMVDLVRSALRNFGQCGLERPTSYASLWHGLLSDDSFKRKFWQNLPNPFSKKGQFWIHPALPISWLLCYLHAPADVKNLTPPVVFGQT